MRNGALRPDGLHYAEAPFRHSGPSHPRLTCSHKDWPTRFCGLRLKQLSRCRRQPLRPYANWLPGGNCVKALKKKSSIVFGLLNSLGVQVLSICCPGIFPGLFIAFYRAKL